ncbi:WbqC family protein [Lacihabitans soyangensis]|nr:WbqC family protein [Lacihabitans soyangensis]
MKKVAIMQPYFLPYIGYFQLINAVDEFIVYDNIQFSKKGWFHRNRFLQNGSDEYFTLPLKKDSDYLNVDQRFLSDLWPSEREKTLRKFKENYRKAPFFESVFPLIEDIYNFQDENLFVFILNSLKALCGKLDIQTPFVISSVLDIDHTLKGQSKVIALCKSVRATHYVNPIGGLELYNRSEFESNGLDLSFIKSRPIEYPQFSNNFVPWLSVLDLLMFNSTDQIKLWFGEFDVIRN